MHGKARKYQVYISISCSGPENGKIMKLRGGKLRTRNGADLKFTTADSDWFFQQMHNEVNPLTMKVKHYRLINPSIDDFSNTLSKASSFLKQYTTNKDWDGGSIILIYAGHGFGKKGSLVFKNSSLVDAADVMRFLANEIPKTSRRLRIDAIVDSCYSGAFLADLLQTAHNELEDRIFPCTLFGASLPDEESLESDRFGHGIFSHSYIQDVNSPPLHNRIKWLWLKTIGRDKHGLSQGGVSYLTDGKQHSFEYENGSLSVHSHGFIRFNLPFNYSFNDLCDALKTAREMPGNKEFSF